MNVCEDGLPSIKVLTLNNKRDKFCCHFHLNYIHVESSRDEGEKNTPSQGGYWIINISQWFSEWLRSAFHQPAESWWGIPVKSSQHSGSSWSSGMDCLFTIGSVQQYLSHNSQKPRNCHRTIPVLFTGQLSSLLKNTSRTGIPYLLAMKTSINRRNPIWTLTGKAWKNH